jgi:4a-hydroxytetrahydrobiopterin dehydratase
MGENGPVGLKDRKCVPCEGGVPPVPQERVLELLAQIPGWRVESGKLRKELKFADFVSAMKFLDGLAEVAESEGHHPDFCVHYNRVELSLWTHAIDGLSENDFILAAKLDALLKPA